MYDELVRRVRQVAEEVCEDYDVDPYNAEQRFFVIEEAADAIEELTRENESLAKSVNEASEILRRRWIPVTERLPEKTGTYLAWMKWDLTEADEEPSAYPVSWMLKV